MIGILRKASKIIIWVAIAVIVVSGIIMMNKLPFEGLCFILLGGGTLLFELGFILVFLEMAENVEILKFRAGMSEEKNKDE